MAEYKDDFTKRENMKRAVVTGASSMIGSNLIRILLEQGMEVTAVVRPGSKKLVNVPESENLTLAFCDVASLSELPQKVSKSHDAWFHFAWTNTYGEARNDIGAQEKNIQYTLDAVKAAHEMGCEVFVGAGSQAEFGRCEGKLSDEMPKNPETAYGIAKYSAGKLSKLLCEQLGMRHVWGRILSTYGPGDNSYTMVMSAIINMLKGEHMAFTKGEQMWDYIYAGDCANAFYLMGLKGVHGRTYTVGSGQGRMLKDYILDIRDVVNPELEVGIGERDYNPGQVMYLVADISQLQEDTGFKPEMDFKEGIKRTCEYYQNIN